MEDKKLYIVEGLGELIMTSEQRDTLDRILTAATVHYINSVERSEHEEICRKWIVECTDMQVQLWRQQEEYER